MKTYTIKLEDKAAFLNRLQKAGYSVASNDIVDDELNGTFTLTSNSPEQDVAIKTILKQSPSINDVNKNKMDNNKKSIKKDELKEMIRQELQGVLQEKKKVKDAEKKEKLDENEEIPMGESLSNVEGLVAGLIGLGIPITALAVSFIKSAIKKGGAVAAEELRNAIDQSKGE